MYMRKQKLSDKNFSQAVTFKVYTNGRSAFSLQVSLKGLHGQTHIYYKKLFISSHLTYPVIPATCDNWILGPVFARSVAKGFATSSGVFESAMATVTMFHCYKICGKKIWAIAIVLQIYFLPLVGSFVCSVLKLMFFACLCFCSFLLTKWLCL